MKSIKILAIAAILFVALAFGISKNNPAEFVSDNPTTEIAPHKLHGPIGMSDDDQF